MREQLRDLQRSLDVISAKVEVYGQEIRDGSADSSWSERACAAEVPSSAPAASARWGRSGRLSTAAGRR